MSAKRSRTRTPNHLFGDAEDLVLDRTARAVLRWQAEAPDLADRFAPLLLLGRLNEAAQLMSIGHLAPACAQAGLKPGEFDVLATLVRSGPPYELTPKELHHATMLNSAGLTARVDRLETAGLARRRPHPLDRRALTICATDKGVDLIREVLPDFLDRQRQAVDGLSDTEHEQLSSLLEKLIRSVHEKKMP